MKFADEKNVVLKMTLFITTAIVKHPISGIM